MALQPLLLSSAASTGRIGRALCPGEEQVRRVVQQPDGADGGELLLVVGGVDMMAGGGGGFEEVGE